MISDSVLKGDAGAAAAGSLQEQAANLQKVVSVFKLDDAGGSRRLLA